MAGLYAVADSSKPTRVDLDNELEGRRRIPGCRLDHSDPLQMCVGTTEQRFWTP